MPIERQHRIFSTHTSAVVADLDQDLPAVLQLDSDVLGAGVKRILHQLFDHRGRTLYHLPGGDLVGNSVWQNCDAASHEGNLPADPGYRARCYPPFPCSVPAPGSSLPAAAEFVLRRLPRPAQQPEPVRAVTYARLSDPARCRADASATRAVRTPATTATPRIPAGWSSGR